MADLHAIADTLRQSQERASIPSQNDALTSINSNYYDDQLASASHSLSSLVGEEILLGSRQNGRMSVVRRFFCLFVLFDLLFISLMWILWIMLIGGNDIIATLKYQIVQYSIHTSLFDIIMAAVSRFVVLLLFYGLLQVNHWCMVALSTAGTCAFLIGKVFVYDWANANQPAFQVCLVLISFVISWGEAWFLDFRVIPQETHAQQYLDNSIRHSDSLNALLNESQSRHPMLYRFFRHLPRADETTTGSINYYSPLESPENSDNEDELNFRTNDAELHQKGEETWETAWKILNSADWTLVKQTSAGEKVFSKKVHPYGKVFKLTTIIDKSPKELFDELYTGIENLPKWNETVIESKRLKIIDEFTDLTYQVSAEGGSGLIASRDFVNLRHWAIQNGAYVISAVSVQLPYLVHENKYIRGENGPGCWALRRLDDGENKCLFQFLLNTNLNLKGWVPQGVLDMALTAVLINYSCSLKDYVRKLKQERS